MRFEDRKEEALMFECEYYDNHELMKRWNALATSLRTCKKRLEKINRCFKTRQSYLQINV